MVTCVHTCTTKYVLLVTQHYFYLLYTIVLILHSTPTFQSTSLLLLPILIHLFLNSTNNPASYVSSYIYFQSSSFSSASNTCNGFTLVSIFFPSSKPSTWKLKFFYSLGGNVYFSTPQYYQAKEASRQTNSLLGHPSSMHLLSV